MSFSSVIIITGLFVKLVSLTLEVEQSVAMLIARSFKNLIYLALKACSLNI